MEQRKTRRCFTVEFGFETVKLVKQSDCLMAGLVMAVGISAKSVGEMEILLPIRWAPLVLLPVTT